ncbi:MAG: HAMP domain-containing protein [Planctomycetota bacterium]|jgi:methyl-accepting chemotaxis protein
MEDRNKHSLALTIYLYTAGVLVVGMGFYAVFQYTLNPGRSVSGLIFEHLTHILVLGVLAYLMVNFVLYRKVVLPIKTLHLKLYSFAGGDFRPASVKSSVREIQEIAESINRMQERIDQASPEVSLKELSDTASEIRDLARRSETMELSDKERLMSAANQIDGTIVSLSKKGLHGKKTEREELPQTQAVG